MTINWEGSIVLWGEPFSTHVNNMQARRCFYSFMCFNPDISLAELDIWQSASLYSFFWQRSAHIGTLHKQYVKITNTPRNYENIETSYGLGSDQWAASHNKKKGKQLSACTDMIWSDPNFFLSNATYWSWMSLTLQGPISQSFQFFLTRAHCSSPFLESTIWHSEGLIKKLCVLNSTSYIFIRGSVSIFLLCRFMFFSGLLSEAEDSGTSQKIWIS